MDRYDEDLLQNPFLTVLKKDYNGLFKTATSHRWTICVPMASISQNTPFNEEDFLNHIIVSRHEQKDSYKTLNDKILLAEGNVLITQTGFSSEKVVPILFEETYFNDEEESYRLVCVGQLFEGTSTFDEGNNEGSDISHCLQILWDQTGNLRLQSQLNILVDHANSKMTTLKSIEEHIMHLHKLFTHAMQVVLKDKLLRKATCSNKTLMKNIKVAVETYVLHCSYAQFFPHFCACFSRLDARLNQLTRSHRSLQLCHLDVRAEFSQFVPRARREVSRLQESSTPLGKLNCLHRAVSTLMQPIKTGEQQLTLTSDDLLPIMVFLIVKAEVPTWHASFHYMTRCRFFQRQSADQNAFYLATLEAALQHIMSGQLSQLREKSVGLASQIEFEENQLLSAVVQNDVEHVRALIADKQKAGIPNCHPLCSCESCLVSSDLKGVNVATFLTAVTEEMGQTALHVAVQGGHLEMTEFLLEKGASVDLTNYQGSTPLHKACQLGHQSVALLLLHFKASVNMKDHEGNTALHLAALHGHEDVIKALVFYDQGTTCLEMNQPNDVGDSALHLAAKWGYAHIVMLLLENGAIADIRNRRRLTPAQYTSNSQIKMALNRSCAQKIQQIAKTLPARMLSQCSVELAGSNRVVRAAAPASHLSAEAECSSSREIADIRAKVKVVSSSDKIHKLLRAAADGDEEMIKFYLGWSDDENCGGKGERSLCHPLCQCTRCQPLQKYFSCGLNVNSCDQDGESCLHVTARHGHLQLVEMLIRRGAQLQSRLATSLSTPLHMAAQHNKPMVLQVLVEQGADVNCQDALGNSPLMLCCSGNCVRGARSLLQASAEVALQNLLGNTALHEAARWGSVRLVRELLAAGADVSATNRKGQRPIAVAKEEAILSQESQEIIEVLEAACLLEVERWLVVDGKAPPAQHQPDVGLSSEAGNSKCPNVQQKPNDLEAKGHPSSSSCSKDNETDSSLADTSNRSNFIQAASADRVTLISSSQDSSTDSDLFKEMFGSKTSGVVRIGMQDDNVESSDTESHKDWS